MIMTLRIAVDPHKSSWTAAPADASLHALAMPRGAGQPRRLPGVALLRALLGAPAVRDRRVAGLGAPPDHATARRSLECRCIGTESRSVANGHLGAESRCIRRRAARPTGARSGRWSPVSHAPPMPAAQAERFPPRLIRAAGRAPPPSAAHPAASPITSPDPDACPAWRRIHRCHWPAGRRPEVRAMSRCDALPPTWRRSLA